MSTKERVLSRCKAVVELGAKCPESGVFVYWHIDFYELCYDGGKLCINADGTGEGFDAAARWLKIDNPWRLTSEELPKSGQWVWAGYQWYSENMNQRYDVVIYSMADWHQWDFEAGEMQACMPPSHWMPIVDFAKPE